MESRGVEESSSREAADGRYQSCITHDPAPITLSPSGRVSMNRLRIGMIGCGEIAVRMAAAIASSRHAKHIMVMDTQRALAQDLGQQHGVPWTDRVDDLLANPAVDAVYIAVPHHLHASLTMQAAEAGKHILVEKPIATT